jgi:YQGE family putative transporter
MDNILKKLTNEYSVFRAQPQNMQILLCVNMLYALILPIVEVFVGAYIMRNTSDPAMVALYQLAMYVGIVFTSFCNGFFLKVIPAKVLYSIGISISALSIVVMMSFSSLDFVQLLVTGFSLGAASGIFWTNRYLLALDVTKDENRNYFFGIETFAFSIASIVVPLGVGALLANLSGTQWLGIDFDIKASYQLVTFIAMAVAIFACWVLWHGKFEITPPKNFIYFKYNSLWGEMLSLSGLKGLVQGFLVTAPAILVMKLVGNEGSLGLIQGISGAVTAILVYVLGRVTKPRHRTIVFGAGLTIFLIGTLVNGVMFSAIGVVIFILCKVLFQPLHDLAYFPIMMRTIDVVAEIEHRNKYTYIMSHEFGMFIGRAAGLILFIVLTRCISQEFALKYALVIVGAIQMLSLPLSIHITKRCNQYA